MVEPGPAAGGGLPNEDGLAGYGAPRTAEPFADFYAREFGALVALAAATSGDRSVAEDLAQDALERVRQRWDEVARYDRPGAYARRVTVNLALSARHRRTIEWRVRLRLRRDHEATIPPPSGRHDEVWAAVGRLPGNQRAAVALHYLEDRPVAEIAEILDCAESTARVHLHRGRARLAELLGDEPEDHDP